VLDTLDLQPILYGNLSFQTWNNSTILSYSISCVRMWTTAEDEPHSWQMPINKI